jgi:hypothetical protein
MKAFRLKPSPLIGKLLSETMDAQVEGKVRSRSEALTYLRTLLPALEAEGKK